MWLRLCFLDCTHVFNKFGEMFAVLLRQHMLRSRQDAFLIKVSDLIGAIVVQKPSLSFTLPLVLKLVVELSDVLQEFAHLLRVQLLAFIVLPTARTVLVVLADVSSQQVVSNLSKLAIHRRFFCQGVFSLSLCVRLCGHSIKKMIFLLFCSHRGHLDLAQRVECLLLFERAVSFEGE